MLPATRARSSVVAGERLGIRTLLDGAMEEWVGLKDNCKNDPESVEAGSDVGAD